MCNYSSYWEALKAQGVVNNLDPLEVILMGLGALGRGSNMREFSSFKKVLLMTFYVVSISLNLMTTSNNLSISITSSKR